MLTNKQFASKKGGNTSIAYWNFNNKTKSTISLADTITNSECIISDGCIAPGTEGCFNILINAKGANVKIAYEVNVIKEENNPSNLYFYMIGTDEHYNTLKELIDNNNFSGYLDLNKEQIKDYTIYWKWPYEHIKDNGVIDETKDIEDTSVAKNKSDYVFEIEVSGSQTI